MILKRCAGEIRGLFPVLERLPRGVFAPKVTDPELGLP